MFPLSPTNNSDPEQQVITPVATPEVKLDKRLKNELLSQVREEGMVIVHCSYASSYDDRIRIWNSTVLIDHHSGSRSRLLHAENIPIAPVWMVVQEGSITRFTLIFAPLPKTCEVFDLFEDIAEENGFYVKGIKRNKGDVYNVNII